MSLLEVLLGGVLFLGASAASLLVWSQAVEAMAADARRLTALDGLEAELRAAEIRLLDPGLLASPAVACGELTGRLAAALELAGTIRPCSSAFTIPPSVTAPISSPCLFWGTNTPSHELMPIHSKKVSDAEYRLMSIPLITRSPLPSRNSRSISTSLFAMQSSGKSSRVSCFQSETVDLACARPRSMSATSSAFRCTTQESGASSEPFHAAGVRTGPSSLARNSDTAIS